MSSALVDLRRFDRYRRNDHPGGLGDETCGAFRIPSSVMGTLRVIASSGEGWDHVSVSLENRTPTWAEMEAIKRLLFRPEATAYQLHVPASDHISLHPHCLHIWRPQRAEIPRPPSWMVG